MDKVYSIGIDIGSTTAKVVVLNENRERVYGKYQRHFADIQDTVKSMLAEVYEQIGDQTCTVSITGSGGLSLAKHIHVDFVQEVIAVTSAVQATVPDADCVIELGGEDAKIIFLKNGVDQRMNGICAGGTGAFIDQMAALLQTDAEGLNTYAKSYTEIYPIAARCGVFAKSDIQPLINDGVARENLAASIFQAVVNQTISGLACGRRITGKVVFLGGPLYFLSELRNSFARTLHLTPENAVLPEEAHLFAASGAAAASSKQEPRTLSGLLDTLNNSGSVHSEMNILDPLFTSAKDYEVFRARQDQYQVPKGSLEDYEGNCYLGIDAGSTTMKLALISEDGRLLYSSYGSNEGDPAMVAKKALLDMFAHMNPNAVIARSCSTGYGEDLMKHSFHLDEGEVETISHYQAARFFEPDVDCIVDIGGQDMKCITIRDGAVDNIILNEACSSGCGSFIENFANSLGCTAEEFASKAVQGRHPVDLGTRCTVFMNSNVKQAQKEGAKVEDIAAGLAYSVIKNALFKVIKLKDVSELGEKFVVQGGTFYNDAVLRCFELTAGQEAIRPDIAGLMGAFGAALIAKERYAGQPSEMLSETAIRHFTYKTQTAHCGGCQNNCRLTVNLFADGQRYISGNRCEKGLRSRQDDNQAPNLFDYKRQRLFDYYIPLEEEQAERGTIGIPRALNLYEDYPFWAVFWKQLGFRTVISPYSDGPLFRLGMDSIPSESECYPAKLAHGHVEWLIREGVDTIFYPCIYYERKEKDSLQNNFNCPMVISYPENIKNNVENLREKNVRFLNPFLAFSDEDILTQGLCEFMKKEFGIDKNEVKPAVHEAWAELLRFKDDVLKEGQRTLQWMEEHQASGIVLAGRPYHLDPEINHGIPEMVHSFGFAVLTEDSIAGLNDRDVKLRATNQWTYHSRLYAAAQYVSTREDLELIQLNSFGCGLDAVTIDQVQDLMAQAGRMYTLLKIDEVSNLGAAKIRVRSMMAAMKMRKIGKFSSDIVHKIKDYQRPEFTQEMYEKKYTILCTAMIPYHFDFIEAAMQCCGYDFVVMREENQNIIDLGLKYVNNDACYPAMITTGQILDAVMSGKYDTDRLAVIMVQTGGGCRASNYVGFIRKALKEAGYEHIPVISASMNGMEKNAGFHYSVKMGLKVLQALIYGDVFMRVLLRVRPYEQVTGSADALYEKWKEKCIADLQDPKVHTRNFYQNCKHVIQDFDRLPTQDLPPKPRVGIVGEVLVKYMPIANNHLVDLLEEEGAEAVLPDFIEFVEYCFWNAIYRRRHLGGTKAAAAVAKIAGFIMNVSRLPVFRTMRRSERFKDRASFREIQKNAQQVLSLGNQCGEGWFLGGEIIDLIHRSVNNIVCAQPFGCLPNHIVGKGIVKKIKEMCPEANIVAIDYDPSASQVNQLNRIKLMMEVAQREDCCSES
ncbi:MAG: 2-hydroxyacyl-CoA dehydratase [Clostridiales bacterium]|nr:2-hydroxyacyl-CoA dehydratase [Clostridiales bacterium]